MRLTFGVTADYANTTADGKLNILGVFTEVNLAQIPGELPHMFLILSFEVAVEESGRIVPLRVTLLDESGDEVVGLEGRVAIPQEHRRAGAATLNQIIGLSGIQFQRPGWHEFAVAADQQRLGTVGIHVNVIEGGQDGD